MFHLPKIISFGSLGLAVWFTAGLVPAEDAVDADKSAPIEVGDATPVFTGRNDQGKEWKLSEVQGESLIVVYFYPADFTTGCIRQAELWRDNMNALSKRGVKVVGISGDSIENHKLFKEAWKLNFTLIADEEGRIAKQFGVPVNNRGGKVRPRGPDRKPLIDDLGNPVVLERKVSFARWTFLIGKDGKILYKNARVNPAKDSQQVLEFIQNREQAESAPKTSDG
jgi:peroxiredoxin Q/BCP